MLTIQKITAIEPHPTARNPMDIVTVEDGSRNIANREGDEPRDKIGDYVVVVPPDYVVPEDVLKHNDLWDDVKDKGILKGSKGNRTHVRKIADVPSEVMLIRVTPVQDGQWSVVVGDKERLLTVDNVGDELGIVEYVRP